MSFHTKAAYSVLFLIFLSTQISHFNGTITQSPPFACEGESITVTCVLTPPRAGDVFAATQVDFIVGELDAAIPESIVNSAAVFNNINFSRFTADVPDGNFSCVTGSITLLSFDATDEGLRIGCRINNRPGGVGSVPYTQTLVLVQAAPPFPPTNFTQFISSFNMYTCVVTFSINWAPNQRNTAGDRYFILLNGTSISTTVAPSYSYDTTLQLDAPYTFSVAASNCAGSSSMLSSTIHYSGYRVTSYNPASCLEYNSQSSLLTAKWDLNTLSYTLRLQYSLQLNIIYTQGNVSTFFTQLTSFTILSFLTSYTQSIIPHDFPSTDNIETNITACLMITQQCGQPYTGSEIFCSYSAKTPTLTTNSSPSTSLPTSTISLTSPSTSLPNTTRSPFIMTNSTFLPATIPSLSSLSTITSTAIVGFVCLIALSFNAVFILVIIFLMRKIRQLSSPSKPAPSHPYEYIDLDKLSGNISSPTQQQSPQDYVHMSSVSKQDTTQPPTEYANLK